MTEERFTFAVRHRHLLERHKAVLEDFGYVCTVEEVTMGKCPVLTLVALRPAPKHPIKFTRGTDHV